MPKIVAIPVITFRLDEILAEKGRGVRDLARSTGVGVATISRIVNNHTRGMTLDVMARICFELKIEPGELYKSTDRFDGKHHKP